MNNDGELLRQFAETRDEACFATVVQRHIGFVYAVCLRQLRDAHSAKDATQAVFVALARKARAVAVSPSVIGWLHRSACYETRNLMRAHINRLARETEAQRLGTASAEAPLPIEALAADLDEALQELPETDRVAILARYFSNASYAEIGSTLHLTENAARMRVDRALAKLRDQLARRGITSTAAALAGALPSYASVNVPGGLAAGVTKASVLAAAGGSGVLAVIGFMSTTKVVTGLAIAAVIAGSVYQYRQASARADLAEAHAAENAAASKQLAAAQREIAELRQRATAVATATPAAAPSAAPTASLTPPPAAIPGVTPKPPKGWMKNGSANDLYEVGVDENNSWGGMPSAYAMSTTAPKGKFGGMMQSIAADAFQGQRVRLTGWIKTEDAAEGGNLWMRVDGKEPNKTLGFDNMANRAPKGTTDWQEHSIVLDVPPDSARLNYGFFVAGTGKMWVNGVTVTPVGTDVPVTNMRKDPPPLAKTPVNLGFAPPAPEK
jgi:RNA polymerase sigma factor (sigma-70 family)